MTEQTLSLPAVDTHADLQDIRALWRRSWRNGSVDWVNGRRSMEAAAREVPRLVAELERRRDEVRSLRRQLEPEARWQRRMAASDAHLAPLLLDQPKGWVNTAVRFERDGTFESQIIASTLRTCARDLRELLVGNELAAADA